MSASGFESALQQAKNELLREIARVVREDFPNAVAVTAHDDTHPGDEGVVIELGSVIMSDGREYALGVFGEAERSDSLPIPDGDDVVTHESGAYEAFMMDVRGLLSRYAHHFAPGGLRDVGHQIDLPTDADANADENSGTDGSEKREQAARALRGASPASPRDGDASDDVAVPYPSDDAESDSSNVPFGAKRARAVKALQALDPSLGQRKAHTVVDEGRFDLVDTQVRSAARVVVRAYARDEAAPAEAVAALATGKGGSTVLLPAEHDRGRRRSRSLRLQTANSPTIVELHDSDWRVATLLSADGRVKGTRSTGLTAECSDPLRIVNAALRLVEEPNVPEQ